MQSWRLWYAYLHVYKSSHMWEEKITDICIIRNVPKIIKCQNKCWVMFPEVYLNRQIKKYHQKYLTVDNKFIKKPIILIVSDFPFQRNGIKIFQFHWLSNKKAWETIYMAWGKLYTYDNTSSHCETIVNSKLKVLQYPKMYVIATEDKWSQIKFCNILYILPLKHVNLPNHIFKININILF
jgi:hypothetical protein